MLDAVTYTATLPLTRVTVEKLATLLFAHRRQIGTRARRRAPGCFDHAVVFLRWMLDATKVTAPAMDDAIGVSTAYRYLHEALAVVAAQAPRRHQAMQEAKAAGYRHVAINGTVIATDRSRATGPTSGVDLGVPPACGGGWSGKRHHHSANIQVITAPDGWPVWTSPVRPGSEHDTAALRAYRGLLEELAAWKHSGRTVLADLGYEGEGEIMRLPIRGKRNGGRSIGALTYNALQTALPAVAERANALLKMTFAALRHVSISPGRIGATTAAALGLHLEHHCTV